MSLSQLEQLPAELLYSLPFDCPIPFPRVPSYAVLAEESELLELESAYADALFSHSLSLDSFARLLLARVSGTGPDAFAQQLRLLILPLNKFDAKWRSITPPIFASTKHNPDPPADEAENAALERVKVGADEKARLLAAHAEWSRQEHITRDQKRAEEEHAQALMDRESLANKLAAQPDAPLAADPAEAPVAPVAALSSAAASWTQSREQSTADWLQQLELLETRLQATLLLTLLSLPPAAVLPAVSAHKARKSSRRDPERDSATLDPELLLDFLTDRLSIWRVMKDVKALGVADLLADDGKQLQQAGEKVVVEETQDEVQHWWQTTVEPLFALRVRGTILTHHRTKLFPHAASTEDALALRLAPPPSPFKARSLLSLDKSARRKSFKDSQANLTDSPTMKRLLSRSKLPSQPTQSSLRLQEAAADGGDGVFKVPAPSRKVSGPNAESQSQQETQTTTVRRNPRKQERPRPLPRGDSQAKSILNRREVSLARRPSSNTALARKKSAGSAGQLETAADGTAVAGDDKKRKRETATLGGATIAVPKRKVELTQLRPTLGAGPRTLVPDTPQKDRSSPASAARAFSRTVSLPSFAQLGASFRPGAQVADVPLRSLAGMVIPPAPVLRSDERADEMDWEAPGAGEMGTPKGKRTNNWSVPDT